METNSISIIVNLIVDTLLIIGGFGAFVVYFCQKRNEKRNAAFLITLQIDEIKDKMLDINEMIVDGVINETSFYETLDIINDNQWEKYKHLFVNKIDHYSYKTINSFYEYALSIKEQLLFAKRLQQNQYFNIQGMLDTNCNTFLMETIKNNQDLDSVENIEETILNNINLQGILNTKKVYDEYNKKKEIIRDIVNSSPYITYIPKQIALTLNKQLTNINSLEVVGSLGYKKLRKIAKIK